jgi:putative copper resistance protein D
MELLVDRFGYLRGRWMPQQDSAGWSDGEFLSAQLQQLQREPQILPPAEDHVH